MYIAKNSSLDLRSIALNSFTCKCTLRDECTHIFTCTMYMYYIFNVKSITKITASCDSLQATNVLM